MQVSNAPVDANAAQDPQFPWAFTAETIPEEDSMGVQKSFFCTKDYSFSDQKSIFTCVLYSLKSSV